MQESLNPLYKFILINKNEILNNWVNVMEETVLLKASNPNNSEVIFTIYNEYINIVVQYLQNPKEDMVSTISDFSKKIVQIGWSLQLVSMSLIEFNKILFDLMTIDQSDEEKMKLVFDFDKWLTPLNYEVLNQYAESWEKIVALQKLALKELSAPLIPIFDNISVLPLVGTIDTERARNIMENLLFGVVKHRSEVVLIDITGVPIVDTMVAHHIIQASEAVRLVGAKCLLVGIRPEIAQTIVNLEIDLRKIITKNSLQAGIEYALQLTNRKIVTLGDRK
ncbi:RsbR protein [Bacillus sp. 7586-K]|uniref:RsbT co-antagonist protein RsbR n=1 Tax=Metabacillus niabensis TaxID=324854 RepID=A0ABT9Z733_9BACI|nr:STAS domain-containing protein [Metabacillus niabensis]MDQ0228074.1 rsbT co-antagonist protein RsbR [Metabacillus niabensis]PAD66876.1 RsbR protein [Bacillus sp. 7586-K]